MFWVGRNGSFPFIRSTQSLISLRPWIALSWERCFAWLCLRSSRSSTHSFHCFYINSKNRTLATGPQRTISAMRRKIYSPGSWQMWLAYTGSNCKLMPGSETGWGWISERRIEEWKGKFINIGEYSEDSKLYHVSKDAWSHNTYLEQLFEAWKQWWLMNELELP